VAPPSEGFKNPRPVTRALDDFNAFKQLWAQVDTMSACAPAKVTFQRLLASYAVATRSSTSRFYVCVLSCPPLHTRPESLSGRIHMYPLVFINFYPYIKKESRCKHVGAQMQNMQRRMHQLGYAHGRLDECLVVSDNEMFIMVPGFIEAEKCNDQLFEETKQKDMKAIQEFNMIANDIECDAK
jgi:hypothetical protein